MRIPAALERYLPARKPVLRFGRGPVVAVTWDQSAIYFLVAEKRGEAVRASRRGKLVRREEQDPLLTLGEHLRAEAIDAKRLVLLLARAELEMTTFPVAGVGNAELPAVVNLELEDKVGESDRELVVDYMLPTAYGVRDASAKDAGPTADPLGLPLATDTAERVIAYWMFGETRDAWMTRAMAAGFQLEVITPRQLGPLGLIIRREVERDGLAVVVVLYHSEIEFGFLRGDEILALRAIRISASDSDSLAEQTLSEIRRTASMTDWGVPIESFEVLLVTCAAELAGIGAADVELLADFLNARVIGGSPASGEGVQPVESVLLGAAADHLLERLPINLLAAKRPPVPPSPARRWAAIGAVAALAVGVGGWTLRSDVAKLSDELAEVRGELQRTEQVAAKFQERADETRVVRRWLEDQTDWLSQLKLLSDRFPESQMAHLRSLRATADSTGGQFDLSVQVRSPQDVAGVEDRLRAAGFAITSQQVNEQANDSEYPWQFEARVRFRQVPLDDREEQETFVSGKQPDVPAGAKAEAGDEQSSDEPALRPTATATPADDTPAEPPPGDAAVTPAPAATAIDRPADPPAPEADGANDSVPERSPGGEVDR